MRLLIQYKENLGYIIRQYSTEIIPIVPTSCVAEIDTRYNEWIKNLDKSMCVEEDIVITAKKQSQDDGLPEELNLQHSPVLIVYIGEALPINGVDLYYELNSRMIKRGNKKQDVAYRVLNLVIENGFTTGSFLLQGLKWVVDKTTEYNLPLIVYGDYRIGKEKAIYRSLLQKNINQLMEVVKGVYICNVKDESIASYYKPSHEAYESYIENSIYTTEGYYKAIKKGLDLVRQTDLSRRSFKRSFQRVELGTKIKSLYDDIFYQQIPDNENIYVSLKLDNTLNKATYEKEGFKSTLLLNGLSLLTGEKKSFDSLSEELKAQITPDYIVQVLTRTPLQQSAYKDTVKLNFTQGNRVTGKGIYIGVVGVEGIDYNNKLFQTEDGKTRVAYLWEQQTVGEGNAYFQEDINAAIAKGDTQDAPYNTMLLGIAGGKLEDENAQYIGIAPDSEILVAKVNPAPAGIQKVYSGNYSETAILLEDFIIGMEKLIAFADSMKKPIVLLLPYGTNLSSHDGSLIRENLIDFYGRQSGVTLITPSGEEADKNHHQTVTWKEKKDAFVEINVTQEKQNVILTIWSQFPDEIEASIYPMDKKDLSIPLQTSRKVDLAEGTFWVRGSTVRMENGCQEILVRLENLKVGKYQMVLTPIFINKGRVDIWLTQSPLNRFVTLSPSSPFVTVPSLGNINSIMCAGTYENRGVTIYRSSGRGYTWDNQITPLLVTRGVDVIAPSNNNGWNIITGTAVSAAILVGVIALNYQKSVELGKQSLPNGLVMANMLAKQLLRIDTVEYPNPSQGYGILDLGVLEKLLKIERDD
ncbi:MAG: hypothetical protein AB9856_18835 [Cellulosilyticaceae bacterium]